MSIVYDTADISDSKSSKLLIYPDPVSSTAYIDTNASAITHIAVFNISGFLIKQFAGNKNELNLSDLNTGSYLKSESKQKMASINK